VLYLAEVKNQSKNFMGLSYQTEFKLLASQNNDQTWNRVIGEEVVVCDSIKEYMGKGSLFILNLGTDNQIQGVPELAGERLLNFLQYLSRIVGKSKTQEGDIEQWRLSLNMQAEELANRQTEVDNKLEYIQQKETELAHLEAEKDKLHQAWEQVREEQRRLQDKRVLKTEQVAKILSFLEIFASLDANFLGEHFNQIQQIVATLQGILDEYWKQLEQDKNQLEQKQQKLEQYAQNLGYCRHDLQLTLESLQQAQTDLVVHTNILQAKKNLLQEIDLSLDNLHNLYQEIANLKDDPANGNGEIRIDLENLENMPLGELENTVNQLQEDMKKLVNFVNMQEEELTLQANYVKEVEQKIAESSDLDKLSLETELADAQEAMKLLNETLVGQRRNVKTQQKILNQHLKILNRRKGILDLQSFEIIDLNPLLIKIEKQIEITQNKKQQLQQESDSLEQSLHQIQQRINQKNQIYQQQQKKVEQEQQKTEQAQVIFTQMESKVNFLEEVINPLQNNLNTLRNSWQNIEPSWQRLNNIVREEAGNVSEIKNVLNNQ
jgi:chromosome segregation ATPase